MSVASCQQIKKPGREVKRNRANRKEIHQMNVSINGNGLERIRRRPPKPAGNTARTSFRGAWIKARIRVCLNSQRGIIPCRLSSLDGLFRGQPDSP